MRVVVDTNVLVSAFCFPGGPPEQVYRLGIVGEVELCTSKTLLAEFGRVLTDKFGWDPARVEDAVSHVARIATIVQPTESVAVIADDPEDDRVLEAAGAAEAGVIVSGDAHLLSLGTWRDIRIVSPAEFIER